MLDFHQQTELPMPYRPEMRDIKRFGIEVEVENCLMGDFDASSIGFWKQTGDPSLKETGIEFVSKILVKEDIRSALGQLYGNVPPLAKKRATFGPRTSIHVHSDITWMSNMTQLTPLIFMYLLCEDLMYRYIEPHRRKNIFCVKTKETKYLRQQFLQEYISGDGLFKYAGFNLRSIFQHGTVEFRMLEGTYDQQKILTWIEFIDLIQTYAKTTEQGLSFKREIKNPDRARSLIYPLYRDFFNEEEIEKSIQSGLEYFRYLCCSPITPKVLNSFLEEGFFSSKVYTKNYVRLAK